MTDIRSMKEWEQKTNGNRRKKVKQEIKQFLFKLKEKYSELSDYSYGGGDMQMITCHYTPTQLALIDVLIEQRWFPNRSELLRNALREYLEHHFPSEFIDILESD